MKLLVATATLVYGCTMKIGIAHGVIVIVWQCGLQS